jgi:hypothetical protein
MNDFAGQAAYPVHTDNRDSVTLCPLGIQQARQTVPVGVIPSVCHVFRAHPHARICNELPTARHPAGLPWCGALSVSGIYRWGRNPQYLGWFLFLLGFALTDWSEWCLAALLVSAIGIHLLILVEEQHLLRQFGDTYRQFCDRVPRYFRLSPHRVPE